MQKTKSLFQIVDENDIIKISKQIRQLKVLDNNIFNFYKELDYKKKDNKINEIELSILDEIEIKIKHLKIEKEWTKIV